MVENFVAEIARVRQVKEIREIMKGYHDLIDHGRREIYQIEE